MARRLTAAGQGADYEAGLTSDDAEISDLDQASQGSHPESEGPAGDDAQEGRQDDEGDEEEEEVDIMNSPLQPWGPDVSARVCVLPMYQHQPLICMMTLLPSSHNQAAGQKSSWPPQTCSTCT